MDIKEYISSGILEQYVLGAVSEQERREVECMSSIYPEIQEALVTYQEKMEEIASVNAIDPPEELKNKVLSAVYKEIENDKSNKGKVINGNFDKQNEVSESKSIWKILAAACFVLFLISTAVYINSRSNYSELEAELITLNEEHEIEKSQINNRKEQLVSTIDEQREYLNFLADAKTKTIQLEGTEKSTSSQVRVYWNSTNEKVYLKIDELPAPPTKKQYQLWAIIDGNPTDMGMLPRDTNLAEIIAMPNKASNVVAFAITLEDEGGKPTPNLEELYVIGNV